MESRTGNITEQNIKPLTGKTILVTRPKEQSGEFVSALEAKGATVLAFPSIRITDPHDWKSCDDAIANLSGMDAVVFTSANAVEYFLKRLGEVKRKELNSKKIFAVGSKTREAALRHGIKAKVISKDFTGKDLGNAMIPEIAPSSRILFPHGNRGQFELAGILRNAGFDVSELIVYENHEPEAEEMEELKKLIERNPVDVCTFFSPSSISNMLKYISPGSLASAVIAVIGPITAEAAKKNGLRPEIMAPHSTSRDLAEAISMYFKKSAE